MITQPDEHTARSRDQKALCPTSNLRKPCGHHLPPNAVLGAAVLFSPACIEPAPVTCEDCSAPCSSLLQHRQAAQRQCP